MTTKELTHEIVTMANKLNSKAITEVLDFITKLSPAQLRTVTVNHCCQCTAIMLSWGDDLKVLFENDGISTTTAEFNPTHDRILTCLGHINQELVSRADDLDKKDRNKDRKKER